MFSSASKNIPCFDFMKNKGVLDTLRAMRPVAKWRPFSANWRFTQQTRKPEGPSPDGGLYQPTDRKSHQTREPWHLLCHGGNSAANPHSLALPRAPWARCGVQGHCPYLP